MKLSRRFFLGSVGAAGVALAAEEKLVDGGLAPVTLPGVPERVDREGNPAPIVPPGAKGRRRLLRRCSGCQLCVASCPNRVLRFGRGALALVPTMGFERGWCRPECTKCGEVCPAGAILPLTREEKAHTHVGQAVWHREACLAAKEGEKCTVCSRHCPAKAITLVPLDPARPEGPQVPVVDGNLCVGCGACENLCPARPLPGLVVKGFFEHREVRPM